MNKTELKRIISQLFEQEEKKLTAESSVIQEAQHKAKVLSAVKALNISVIASMDLSKVSSGETGLFPSSEYYYPCHNAKNILEGLALFQGCDATDDAIYSKLKEIYPKEDSPEVLLLDEAIDKLRETKNTILNNLKGLNIKDGLAYLKSIGVDIPEEEKKT